MCLSIWRPNGTFGTSKCGFFPPHGIPEIQDPHAVTDRRDVKDARQDQSEQLFRGIQDMSLALYKSETGHSKECWLSLFISLSQIVGLQSSDWKGKHGGKSNKGSMDLATWCVVASGTTVSSAALKWQRNSVAVLQTARWPGVWLEVNTQIFSSVILKLFVRSVALHSECFHNVLLCCWPPSFRWVKLVMWPYPSWLVDPKMRDWALRIGLYVFGVWKMYSARLHMNVDKEIVNHPQFYDNRVL